MKARPPDIVPRLPFRRDYDYAARLDELRPVLVSLDRCGRSGSCINLLLEKALRSIAVAAFPHARDAANSALDLDPTCQEAHWLRALACLGMGLNHLGLLATSPALIGRDVCMTPALDHIDEARSSLTQCLELTEHRDQEAADLLDYLEGLGDSPSDAVLRAKLQPLLC